MGSLQAKGKIVDSPTTRSESFEKKFNKRLISQQAFGVLFQGKKLDFEEVIVFCYI